MLIASHEGSAAQVQIPAPCRDPPGLGSRGKVPATKAERISHLEEGHEPDVWRNRSGPLSAVRAESARCASCFEFLGEGISCRLRPCPPIEGTGNQAGPTLAFSSRFLVFRPPCSPGQSRAKRCCVGHASRDPVVASPRNHSVFASFVGKRRANALFGDRNTTEKLLAGRQGTRCAHTAVCVCHLFVSFLKGIAP